MKTQGGSYADHGLWTEEYIPGNTLDELVEELTAEEGLAGDRLPEIWHFLVSSCTALVVDFWKRTGRCVTLAGPAPKKVVLPAHDWQVGGRLVSIADRVPCERLLDVLDSVDRGMLRPLRRMRPDAPLGHEWRFVFSAALEVLGEEEGIALLEEESGTLQLDREVATAAKRFVSGVRRHGFLPVRIRMAARRYRRWAQLNARATLEAQAATLDQIETAYGLEDLDRERPGSRLQLYRHTVFRGGDDELTKGLDEVISRTLREAMSRSRWHREVTSLRERFTPTDREEFFLARMLYPHVDPRAKAVLVREEDAPGEFDTGIEVERRDRHGDLFHIRRPANPNEITALYRIFRIENFRRMPTVARDELLVAIDERNRVIGGIIFRRESDTYVRLEWVVVGRHRRDLGIGAALLQEFLDRMRAQGVRVVSTGFFRPTFFTAFGFGIDPRYAGLVRFLEEEEVEERHVEG